MIWKVGALPGYLEAIVCVCVCVCVCVHMCVCACMLACACMSSYSPSDVDRFHSSKLVDGHTNLCLCSSDSKERWPLLPPCCVLSSAVILPRVGQLCTGEVKSAVIYVKTQATDYITTHRVM